MADVFVDTIAPDSELGGGATNRDNNLRRLRDPSYRKEIIKALHHMWRGQPAVRHLRKSEELLEDRNYIPIIITEQP